MHEYIVVGSKESFRRERTGTDTISRDEFLAATMSLWELAPESARRVGHPAPFPVELPRRLIELYTFAGDLVLDPFMGVATTAVAAIETDRKYVGYEINAEYLELAKHRLSDSGR